MPSLQAGHRRRARRAQHALKPKVTSMTRSVWGVVGFVALGASLSCQTGSSGTDLAGADTPPADASPGDPEPGRLAGITQAHNDARRAKGVADLTWSSELAAAAQSWADQMAEGCFFKHSGNGYGENLYGASPAGRATGADAVTGWVSEEQWYDYASNTCSAPPDDSCGHYTQVVWAASTKLGCAMAACADGSWEYVVCNYDPPGNNGKHPY